MFEEELGSALQLHIAPRKPKKPEMEKMMNILKPKPNPQQLLRDWQRRLRQECRNIERQIRGFIP